MKLIHHITINLFVRIDEDKEALVEKLAGFMPEKFEEERIMIEEQDARIDDGVDMTLYTVKLSKTRHCKETIETIKEMLGKEQCKRIAQDSTRVDDGGNLYLRIDKRNLVEKNKAVLVDHGNCLHFKITVAAYPKTKENACKVVKELFGTTS